MFEQKIKLFNLAGYKVNLDISWFIIAFLLIWTLSAGIFPLAYPNLSVWQYFFMGIIATLGLFLSIIIHEFSHAMVAKHYGMPIRGMTLFIFGGIAEMSDEPKSPKQEFWMALAGPVVSIILSGIFYLVYRTSLGGDWGLFTTGVLDYLWKINLILAVFNLIPAFPLDGGRILRSGLWKWSGNIKRATRISSNIGLGFGLFLILLGVFSLLMGQFVGGVWYILLGIFIRYAAQASYGQTEIRDMLSNRKVTDFMETNPVAVSPETTLQDLSDNYFYRYHTLTLPVIENDEFIGAVTASQCAEIPKTQWDRTTVGDIMETKVDSLLESEAADRALFIFNSKKINSIPVLSGKRLVGMINANDVLDFLTIEGKLHVESDRRETERKSA